MSLRILHSSGDAPASPLHHPPPEPPSVGWVWLDVQVEDQDSAEIMAVAEMLGLDFLAVRDAIEDTDLPKVDDFGHHLLIVLHGLRKDEIATYQLHCFLTSRHLLTVRRERSDSLDALWAEVQIRAELAMGGADELLGRLADVLNRQLRFVLGVCEDHLDDLLDRALGADEGLLEEVTGVRRRLAQIRHVVHSQREALDDLRTSTSNLISGSARRRFSDVFDVASRVGHELESARTALAETLDAHRGAQSRRAAEGTLVLAVYAAIMLPLSLVAGFFGMNFDNLPGVGGDWGWMAVAAGMLVVAVISLGVFVSLGWIRRPSGRRAGMTLGGALMEAARAPAQVPGTAFEVSMLPLHLTATREMRGRSDAHTTR